MDPAVIDDCIARADRLESKLDEGPLSVGGFTSIKIRHLMNNLGAASTAYFEVGSHIGATYISACYKNEQELVGGYSACDSFCEFNSEGITKAMFLDNCGKYLINHSLREMDCWKIKKLYEHKNTDLYLYDGAHDLESQIRAVTHFAPLLAEEFVMVVDDAGWPTVMRGTYIGIAKAGLEIVHDRFMWNEVGGDPSQWWNGVMVLLLKRKG